MAKIEEIAHSSKSHWIKRSPKTLDLVLRRVPTSMLAVITTTQC